MMGGLFFCWLRVGRRGFTGAKLLIFGILCQTPTFGQSSLLSSWSGEAAREITANVLEHAEQLEAEDLAPVDRRVAPLDNVMPWLDQPTPAWPRFALPASKGILVAKPTPERFHWKPALRESFEFLVFEHGFRLANDSYATYLLFHRPFWHDYLASASHFDMGRWGDGDDFLVNYIGHPLEGAVSGNIFIQNDPSGRTAKFGRSSVYWKSRFKSLMWAAVYSAYFEIGPIFSETALGNEGGFTYIVDCGWEPAPNSKAEPVGTCHPVSGRQYKPPTNNTGWVDFVVTPTIGMGWILLEDALETNLVDKLAKGRRIPRYNLMRAALSPSRSMANMLAGKWPWYRYEDDHSPVEEFGLVTRPVVPRPAWKDDPRWGLGLEFTSLNLPMDREGCAACRGFSPGLGFSLDYRLMRFLYLDTQFTVFPGSGSYGEHGMAQEGLFGVKVGNQMHSWGLFSQLRPGFINYSKVLVPGSTDDYQSTMRFAFDFGGVVEYYASKHSTLRFDIGTTLVHYNTGRLDAFQPPTTVLSDDYYVTQGNFHVTTGFVFRF